MSSIPSRSAMSAQLKSLEDRMDSADFDIRTQVLIDLQKDILRITEPSGSSSTSTPRRTAIDNTYCDEFTETKLVERVLKLVLNDDNAEVKNAAVTCIGTMARKSRQVPLKKIVNGLLDGIAAPKDEIRDIACLALKAVVSEMPSDSPSLGPLLETLISKVFGILTKTSPVPDPQLASELLQILTDVYLRFSYLITASASIQTSSLSSLIKILSTARTSIRKRAIPALSALVSTNSSLFDTALKGQLLENLGKGGDNGKIWVAAVASLARGQSAGKVGAMMVEGKIVDTLLEQTADTDESEAVEGALVALEVLVLRCPTEITSYIGQILQRSLDLVKHDPNYVNLDDDDVEMNGEDEDEDFEDDAYSDDEDVSWKIRRSAAKLLYALIGTRNDLLGEFYKLAAPVLISRFSEREESVRLEILAAFEALLKQTSAARAAESAAIGRNKRKRSQGMDEDDTPEDSPIRHLNSCHQQLLRATLKQLSSKSVATRQECFVLLRQTDEALGGGLESEADAICTAATSAVRSVETATSSSLAMAALSFLAVFFRHHSSRVYASHLDDLVPAIIRCMVDKLQRVNFEAFTAASSLARSLRPNGSASPLATNSSKSVQQLFSATISVLADTSVDSDVRERALETLGTLLVHEGDALTLVQSSCFPLITSRLATETTANTAVQVIGRIAESPTCTGTDFEAWLLQVLPEVIVALRKTRRSSGKNAEFICLQSILARVGTALPNDIAENLVVELKPFVDSPLALSTASLILSLQPSCRGAVDINLIPRIYETMQTLSPNAQLVDSLVSFFAAYVEGDPHCATRLVPSLVDNLPKTGSLPDATQGGTLVYSTASRCIGAIVQHARDDAAGIFATFNRTIKSSKASETDVYLALLCMGEIGRTVDLSGQPDLLERVLGFFENESEEVRSAAAFAAGNLAVGSPNVLLPAIVEQIDSSGNEASRLLLLHALKEVILHSSSAQLEVLADSFWTPLFADDSKKTSKTKTVAGGEDIGDDGIRNVKAACIGKLTTTAPAKFLPQLQELLRSSPRNRAIVAAAVRYTFIDTSSSYDELIAPIIVDFLSLMHDENLIVRRLSLASLNAAIQNKPHLIVDRLTTLQPLLYQETYVKLELQREVQMGPWKVIEDDGLENRKTAYETMYTLLGTCFAKVDLPTFTDRVMAALHDVNEIKVLGLMLLLRLGRLSPASVIPRLDDVAVALKVIMKDLEVKDDTVKQDLERKEEMQRTTLRTAVPLYKMSNQNQAPVFHAFVGGLLAKTEWKDFRDYQA